MEYPLKPLQPTPPLWETEPSVVRWIDPNTGLHCMILRHRAWKHLNGYVRLTTKHPLYRRTERFMRIRLDVHGGVTFDRRKPVFPTFGYSLRGRWIGFDCAHLGDLSPGLRDEVMSLKPKSPLAVTRDFLGNPFGKDIYRDLRYVREEVTRLAAQLNLLGKRYV